MGRSIEYNIRFKAAIIYVIVAVGVVATILYLNRIRKDISTQRTEIANRRALLSATNKLIFTVSEAQSFSSLYLSTKSNTYLRHYNRSLDSIGVLIDTISLLMPNEASKLHRIDSLLREQARNITTLNRQFVERNPVAVINERIKEYEPAVSDTLHIVTIRKDTVVSEKPRKGFFKRLKEVFKPDREPLKITVDQRTDTIRTPASDSLAIIQEVGDIAQKAQSIYDQHIKTIEKRVGRLISTDKNIAAEISALLLELHEETLGSTLAIIEAREHEIDRNYTYSTTGGVLALALILIFIVLIITDINKGARARHALEQANTRIRQIMESRHRLLLSVSHDIKTPLNSMLGYLGQLGNGKEVQSMRNSSEHILSMLENLLEFSSLEKGTLQKSESDFNLRELCGEIHDMFLPLAVKKLLAFSSEADDVRIHTDRVKLKQIIINLVSNSIKYTPHGSVRFSAHFDRTKVCIEVSDTGAGIPQSELPLLFKPFHRIGQNNTLAEGSGFGMFVVKGLVDLLDGRIEITSEVGAGTTVHVTVPTIPASRKIPKGTKHIRIYDDDPIIIRMLSDMLTGLGHHIATNGDCDLIITDLEMGETSGLDILRGAAGKPVVIMTGRANFTSGQAQAMGFDGFLAKPFSASALREIVGDGEGQDDLLGDDREAILTLFRTATTDNFGKLRQALIDEDYHQAQGVCHKMFPMFAQLGYPTDELRRMDTHREGPYEGWQQDLKRILAIKV